MSKQLISNKKICFLGAGNMAEVLISGLIESKKIKKRNIVATDIRPERLRLISRKFSISVSNNNINAATSANIIVIAVKPQHIGNLLEEISGRINPNQLVISIAAGVTTKYIEKYISPVPVIRIMPNTPALVKEAMFVICGGRYAKRIHVTIVSRLLSPIGTIMVQPENMFNIVTAISGSGPAYVFYIAESMIKTAEKHGFSKRNGQILVNQTIFGAGKMLKTLNDSAEILRKKVTSPGGTTEQAIKYFKDREFSAILDNAIKLADMRAKELTI